MPGFDASLGSTGTFAPSAFMDPATYPIRLNALVGTFADSAGVIVRTPFAINNGPLTVTVPVGATRLQLGINDHLFDDNTGALMVRVESPPSLLLNGSFEVPRASTMARSPR